MDKEKRKDVILVAKVIVGMSGGVDSSVVALLLKEAGYDVIGVTLRTWDAEWGNENLCCKIDDARKAAWKLDIPYYTLNCAACFQEKVIKPFINAYICAMTPNPCVECNRYVKWERMLYIAGVMQADYIATGHYASVVRLDNGRYTVQKAECSEKDQTYMLYKLTQEQLRLTLMPLGQRSKDEVRRIADGAGLPTAHNPDSQEICFVTDNNYAAYIENNYDGKIPEEGYFVDEQGNILGRHRGIIHYTVGQRKHLGLSLGYPVYVKRIAAENEEIIVGKEHSLYCNTLICGDVNFMGIPALKLGESLLCKGKIRYHHAEQNALIEMIGRDRMKAIFEEPVRAAAPGQSAVFYDESKRVIAGGIILETL